MLTTSQRGLTIAALLALAGCGKSPTPVTRPTPNINVASATPAAGAISLSTLWQSRVLLERRDSLILTLPNGSKQLQRLGRNALFTLTIDGKNLKVTLDSLQLIPASAEASKEAVGTTWTGWLGAYGKLENFTASRGGVLVEELTQTVANLLPRLPRGGARPGDRWADTSKKSIRVEIFRTDDQRTGQWRVAAPMDREGIRVIPVQVREAFEQIGRGSSAGRNMTMTAQGSRSAQYYMTLDGRVEVATVIDSAAKLITIPGSQQSIPTMQYSRTMIRFRPLVAKSPNE
ncbi:MAG: hypothetical protein KBF28_04635 [Gemmatimonadales bacterium]|nr:hypothetical protein [Gemmatimonadales bacterium]